MNDKTSEAIETLEFGISCVHEADRKPLREALVTLESEIRALQERCEAAEREAAANDMQIDIEVGHFKARAERAEARVKELELKYEVALGLAQEKWPEHVKLIRDLKAEVERLREALTELAGYVRAHLAGNNADPELRWALEQADAVLADARDDHSPSDKSLKGT